MKHLVGHHMSSVFKWFRKRKRIIKTLRNESSWNIFVEAYVKCLHSHHTCIPKVCVEEDNTVLTALAPEPDYRHILISVVCFLFVFSMLSIVHRHYFCIKERDSSHSLFTTLLSENKVNGSDHQTRCPFSSPSFSLALSPFLQLNLHSNGLLHGPARPRCGFTHICLRFSLHLLHFLNPSH